jgi:hypothetical protein
MVRGKEAVTSSGPRTCKLLDGSLAAFCRRRAEIWTEPRCGRRAGGLHCRAAPPVERRGTLVTPLQYASSLGYRALLQGSVEHQRHHPWQMRLEHIASNFDWASKRRTRRTRVNFF